MQTVKQVYEAYQNSLKSVYDVREIEAITNLSIGSIIRLPKAQLKAFPDRELNDEQIDQLNSILNALQTGEPLQYILGHTEFYGLSFNVNPSVLIPRPETEELVHWILETVINNKAIKQNILDIGTGSGCIAVTLKHKLKNSVVAALDISPAALQTAKQNADLNQVEINFQETNILNWKPTEITQELYTLIVSNPPYVTETDKQQMHRNVTDFEPHTALFVLETNPLLFYNAIADFASQHLTKGGYLFFEINESYGQQTVNMLTHKLFINIELRKDMLGKDRMIKAIWPM
ncbi:peptide chain release factor N(5)-glutamine methyltransferase [Mucilaginibacter robiniae]|uniref:peptide chain release factor N(5)-glutamine methyltransferase n=1 Tax=Mucilaginibacter robiniae TaxID=2728022 RepID=A0A7L5E508_9SPHI|nr:peptide chain release factor N(5)-glutamine methyltransferase [Mucilaginibacter robiniae]QJD98121.1 peptide chain release factor N(5)-glutamine methyltransferase [Mucilaginibacter robiniae]